MLPALYDLSTLLTDVIALAADLNVDLGILFLAVFWGTGRAIGMFKGLF